MRVLLFTLLLAGCNSGTGDDGTPEPSACGLAGLRTGEECNGLDECGASNNAIEPEFCENCLIRPDTHVCEAGTCRPLGPKGNIQTAFAIPLEAEGSKSYTLATLIPTMGDGSKVTCEKLMSPSCSFLHNPAINTTNSTFKRFNEPARSDSVYPALSSVEAGTGRILFIQVTSDEQGKGTVTARGCVDGISVSENETVQVPIDILPP